MSFMDCNLPYVRQWLITCLLAALLPFQPFFTETLCGDQFLTPPPFSSVLTGSHPLCCVFLLNSLFIIQFLCFVFFFFCRAGISLPRGYADLSKGWLWEYHVMLT
jgi:hypothetical protein